MHDELQTYVLRIEYDGTQYSGWQRQNNAHSVQAELEKALYKLTHCQANIIGSGRTDAGVHASGQIAHFRVDKNKVAIPPDKFLKAFNSRLPKDIRVNGLIMTDNTFHSTKHATYREYSYTITTKESVFKRLYSTYFPYPFDQSLLIESAEIFLGEHDFTSFSKYNASTQSYICDVKTCQWNVLDPNSLQLVIGANRFVYAMVRTLVGTMLEMARKNTTKQEISNLLIEPKREKKINITPVMPPQGLVLQKVEYPLDYGIIFND